MPHSNTAFSRKRTAWIGVGSILLAATWLVTDGRSPETQWARIPSGAYAPVAPGEPSLQTSGFEIARTPVTVRQFIQYLQENPTTIDFESPQIQRTNGRYRSQVDPRKPVTFIDHATALHYAAWRDTRDRHTIRLPTTDEWIIAARGGPRRVRYPWGWAHPNGRARFDCEDSTRVARFPANGFGLFDMAGNVAEWCMPENRTLPQAPAMGGSWAERDPDLLRISRKTRYPTDYRDADVGLRLVRTRW